MLILIFILRRPEALRRFAHQRFAPGLEDRFLSSKGSRDLVIYSLLRVKDYALARELWIRLEEDETTFAEAAREFGEGPEADRQGVIGPIPIGPCSRHLLQDVLRGLKAGEMSPPFAVGEWQILLRLEKLTPTRLDDQVREQMLMESLDQFLDDRVRKINAGEGDSSIRFTTIRVMTQQSAATFEGLLRRFSAFRDLDDERLQWLAQRARPFHCTVGQELLRPDRMPEYCFCIVEGRGRLLHDDPGLRRPG